LEYKSVNSSVMWTRTRKTRQPIPVADPSPSAGVIRTLSHPMKRLRRPSHALWALETFCYLKLKYYFNVFWSNLNNIPKNWGRQVQPLISSFRRVLNVVFFLLGNSPTSGVYVPTFRNTLSVPYS
jgi:hypothetical protein